MNSQSARGFTLVEVIVTAMIVAILAGVAIPSYLGYVNQSRQEAVNTLAETAAAAANSFWRKTNSSPTLAQLNLQYDSAAFLVAVDSPSVGMIFVKRKSGTEVDTVLFK